VKTYRVAVEEHLFNRSAVETSKPFTTGSSPLARNPWLVYRNLAGVAGWQAYVPKNHVAHRCSLLFFLLFFLTESCSVIRFLLL